jgi:exopolysaccharide biosynthesis protein
MPLRLDIRIAWIALTLLLTPCAAAVAQTPDPGCTSKYSGMTPLFVGVLTEKVEITCPTTNGSVTTTAFAVRVELTAPGLSFEASSQSSFGKPFNTELTTAFLQRTKSQIAFNANLFTDCCSDTASVPADTCGLEISDGHVLSQLRNKPKQCDPSFLFDASLTVTGNALGIAALDHVDPKIRTAITGSHLLVSSGNNVAPKDTSPTDFFGPNARTTVGLSAANDVLWIVAVERGPQSRGLTLPQAAQLMMQLGAATALNLDGGGSTALAVDAGGGKVRMLNTPNDSAGGCTFPAGDKCERYVGATFGIHAQWLPQVPR